LWKLWKLWKLWNGVENRPWLVKILSLRLHLPDVPAFDWVQAEKLSVQKSAKLQIQDAFS